MKMSFNLLCYILVFGNVRNICQSSLESTHGPAQIHLNLDRNYLCCQVLNKFNGKYIFQSVISLVWNEMCKLLFADQFLNLLLWQLHFRKSVHCERYESRASMKMSFISSLFCTCLWKCEYIRQTCLRNKISSQAWITCLFF